MALMTWRIEVDDRERAGGVVDALAAYPQVVAAIGRLPLGDYLPGGGVVVERKTAADLILSIRDQRLFDQAARLRAGSLHPLLILEGDPLTVGTGMHKNAILGALTWLTTIQGIPLLPSVVKPKVPTPREQRLAVLAALPGVGPVLAACLVDHFGSLRGMLDADAEALSAVPGIGEELAARLAALLR